MSTIQVTDPKTATFKDVCATDALGHCLQCIKRVIRRFCPALLLSDSICRGVPTNKDVFLILQCHQAPFPNRTSEILFLTGLGLYAVGQVFIKLGQPFVEAQRPIDFAHWFLYVGALFLLPYAARLPLKNIHLLTVPTLIAGVSFVIGMCVLDFIFWSLPNNDLERELATHLINTPVIWAPFVTFGSGYIFVTGLVLPSLSYWHVSKRGPCLVVLSSIIMAVLSQWWMVLAYGIMIIGYFYCFDMWSKVRDNG